MTDKPKQQEPLHSFKELQQAFPTPPVQHGAQQGTGQTSTSSRGPKANRIASGFPDARLAEIEQKEKKIEEDRKAADFLLENARTEADRIRRDVECECKSKKAELSRRAVEIENPLKEEKEKVSAIEGALKARRELCETLSKQLEDRTRQLEERHAELVISRKRHAEAEGRAADCKRAADTAAAYLAEEKKKYVRLSERYEDLKGELEKRVTELSNAQRHLEQRVERVNILEHEVDSALGRMFAHCPRTAEWIAGLKELGEGLNWPKEIATTGSDPFDVKLLDSVLWRREHKVYHCRSCADVLIVGREGWTPEELREQYDSHEGSTLRIYSQEMAVLALVTGTDPFDAGDVVLLEMGKGHPALEYLMENQFKWPSIGKPLYGGDDDEGPPPLGPTSPLTEMGYHVGKTSRLSDEERRKLLERIYRKDDLDFPDRYSEADKHSWGGPETPRCLRMMAEHIAWNIRFHAPQVNYRRAVEQWEADLAWLKKKFYRGGFGWPDTNV